MKQILSKLRTSRQLQLGAFLVIFAVIGIIYLLVSHALVSFPLTAIQLGPDNSVNTGTVITPTNNTVKGKLYLSSNLHFTTDPGSNYNWGVDHVNYYAVKLGTIVAQKIGSAKGSYFGPGLVWDTTRKKTDGTTEFPDATYVLSAQAFKTADESKGADGQSSGLTVQVQNNPTPPSGTCPALPAFPTPGVEPGTDSQYPHGGCTGWRHTGVTLAKMTPAVAKAKYGMSPNGFDPCVGPVRADTPTGNWDVLCPVTIDSADFTITALQIRVSNVTIKRSRLSGKSNAAIKIMPPNVNNNVTVTNIQITDTEITSQNVLDPAQRSQYGLSAYNTIMTRLYIHDVETGVNLFDNTTLQDSWIGNTHSSGEDPHTTGIGGAVDGNGGAHHVKILHNYDECTKAVGNGCTSGMEIQNYSEDIHIEGNLLEGAGVYAFYPNTDKASNDGTPPNCQLVFVNNYFGVKQSPDAGEGRAYTGWGNACGNNVWGGSGKENRWYVPPGDETKTCHKNNEIIDPATYKACNER